MVKYETELTTEGVRSLFEGLAESADLDATHSATSCKIKIPYSTINSHARGKEETMIITLNYMKNTGHVQVNSGATIIDKVLETMTAIDANYLAALSQNTLPPPRGAERAASTYRIPPSSKYPEPHVGRGGLEPALHVPQDRHFKHNVKVIADLVTTVLKDYPKWRERMLEVLIVEFGLSDHHSIESFLSHTEYDDGEHDGTGSAEDDYNIPEEREPRRLSRRPPGQPRGSGTGTRGSG